jgi:hypothetical protein
MTTRPALPLKSADVHELDYIARVIERLCERTDEIRQPLLAYLLKTAAVEARNQLSALTATHVSDDGEDLGNEPR